MLLIKRLGKANEQCAGCECPLADNVICESEDGDVTCLHCTLRIAQILGLTARGLLE